MSPFPDAVISFGPDVAFNEVADPDDINKLRAEIVAMQEYELSRATGFIDGLKMIWNSGTSITVDRGAAFVPGVNKMLELADPVTKSGLSLSANTWYHVYLYLNGSTPDIEISTTAPDVPYWGTARYKTGFVSRRYLGSLRTNASAQIYNFLQTGLTILYRDVLYGSPFRALNGGVATAETSVSLSAVVPITSRTAQLYLLNLSTSHGAYFGTSDDSASGPPTNGISAIGISSRVLLLFPISSSQAITYWYPTTPSGGAAYIDVYGYVYER